MFDEATLDNIISILDYTLLGLFIAFLVVLVLAFFRGLFRGWRYATYRLVFFTLFVVLAFLTARPLAQMLGTMDISSFGLPALNFSLNVSGTTINVSAAWTTPLDTIASVADQILRGMDINMNPADLVNYSYSLALSFITIILLFADAILIAIFGTLFIWFMWHLAFNRFIKKSKRKASYKKGNRPSYIKAAPEAVSRPLYERFVRRVGELTGGPVATGVFGADMQVALLNDGPVTIWIDSKNKE